MPNRVKTVIVHPFVLAIFPIWSLYVHNGGQLSLDDTFSPILFTVVVAVFLWLTLTLFLKDRNKSAIITSIFLILFFSFGQIISAFTVALLDRNLWNQLGFLANTTWGRSVWLVIWSTIFIAITFLILKTRYKLQLLGTFLNIFSIALMLLTSGSWFFTQVSQANSYQYIDAWHQTRYSETNQGLTSASVRPNIYYIILDGYGRADILNSVYHLDNSQLYTYLLHRDFYIANQSRSNYMQTPLSLASSLNAMYLDSLVSQIGSHSTDTSPLAAMIQDNTLFHELREQGYTIVSFSTGFPFTEIKTSDVYLTPPQNLTPLQNTLINTTPLPLLLELPGLETQFDLHRNRILYTFDHLVDTTRLHAPVFVFAHILSPHPPFVFGAKGEPIDPEGGFNFLDGSIFTALYGEDEYIRGYRNQLSFLNIRLQTTIEQILAQSPNPPVIILQADHGPGALLDWTNADNSDLSERMSILNAYYFPDQHYNDLYSTITPVNTFRITLNKYFGTNYELVPDKNYFSSTAAPYSFTDVTNR